ncbi:MAG: hypothetical protein ABN502_01140, partial [Gammaproteobacteria bacterium]
MLLLLVILREMGSTSSRGGAPISMAYECHCGAALRSGGGGGKNPKGDVHGLAGKRRSTASPRQAGIRRATNA